MNGKQSKASAFWRMAGGYAAIGFGAVAAFFLFTEHRVHLFGILPYLLLLACPIMMMFMHHGHDHSDHEGHSPGESNSPRTTGRDQP